MRAARYPALGDQVKEPKVRASARLRGPMKPLRVEERRVRARDGTDLAYHVAGSGMPVLLANGLGGSYKAWQHQIGYLESRCRFVSWDYRGLYRSGPPGTPDALRIDDQVHDAIAILDAEGIERTAVFGWSMGVQLALELFLAFLVIEFTFRLVG